MADIEKTIRRTVCSRCRQDCQKKLEQMRNCDLVKSYIRTHKNKNILSKAVYVGIIDTYQIRRRKNDIIILSNPTREDLRKILSTICKRFHDKIMPCSGCPIDQALKDLNIAMDTFKIFYAPFFPVNCKCHGDYDEDED